MPRTCLRREVLLRLLLGSLPLASLTGCGTILYPERRGQPGGPIDWKVVALDGIFLLLFVIPGVVAFAVDFSSGAIYLPTHCEGTTSVSRSGEPLRKIDVPRSELSAAGIEAAVSKAVGRAIRLVKGEYATEELDSVENFAPAAERLALRAKSDPTILRCQSE